MTEVQDGIPIPEPMPGVHVLGEYATIISKMKVGQSFHFHVNDYTPAYGAAKRENIRSGHKKKFTVRKLTKNDYRIWRIA